MNPARPQLLVIGLDGYDPVLAERFMAEGRMPHLQQIMARSACFTLEHGEDRYSGLSWEHVSTGQGPELSGRWSAVDFDPRRYTVTQVATRSPPFVAGLSARTVLFDAPYFDLAQAPSVRGLVNWGAHDPGVAAQANPASLAAEVEARFGPYAAQRFIYGFTWPDPALTHEAGIALTRAVEQRAAVARWLLRERCPEWDLAFLVVSEFHSVIEPLWHGVDEGHPLHCHPSAPAARAGIESVYAAADALIGQLAADFPEATLVAFAMHGMGRNAADVPAMLLLPELLHRDFFGSALFCPPSAWRAADPVPLRAGERWEQVMRAHFRHPAAPSFIKRLGAALRGRRLLQPRATQVTHDPEAGASLDWMPVTQYARYWQQMDVFALPSFYDGRLRVNLRGREAQGRVSLRRYPEVLARARALLEACIDPATGAPAIASIEVITGDPLQRGPSEADLRILWAGSPTALHHPRLGTLGPVPWRRTGGHTGGAGVAFFAGAGIKAGDYGCHSSMDVVPTVCALLDEKPVRAVSGRSLLHTGFIAPQTRLAETVAGV
jgi:predicted AlkP superfamily phosphohydrolase/phosphomutase